MNEFKPLSLEKHISKHKEDLEGSKVRFEKHLANKLLLSERRGMESVTLLTFIRHTVAL